MATALAPRTWFGHTLTGRSGRISTSGKSVYVHAQAVVPDTFRA
ncbi:MULTISPECIES: hypothetical protein [Streptomyces]|nr:MULTISPECIES: hypothetical protein [Streptomyces]